MKFRPLDILLILAILIGGVLAWRTGREQGRLWETYQRLSRKAGDLAVNDPSQVYVMALKTDDPMHFAWRVHLPSKYKQDWRTSWGTSGSSWNSNAREFIARLRFREDGKGGLDVYAHLDGGSSRSGLGNRTLIGHVHGRWDKLRVEQLGTGEVVAIDPNEPVNLLKLTMPDDMQAEARKKLPPYDQEKYVPTFFEFGLGPEKKPKP